MNILLVSLALALSPVLAAPGPPTLAFPLQAQRPPVARVNRTWSWSLLPGTFNASSGSIITLSSRSLPGWASFDAASSTFSGMPSRGDEGLAQVTVQANVSGVALGALDTFGLLVTDDSPPYTRLSLASQLPEASSFGSTATYALDGALLVPPTWSFSLGFQQYTFEDASKSRIFYSAYESGSTSLPDWLNFDNTTVTFDGVAPRQLGEYSVTVFGSSSFGYGDISEVFKIRVGSHAFDIVGTYPELNVTATSVVRRQLSLDPLRLDGQPVLPANISSSQIDLRQAPYLRYDPGSRVISGLVPPGTPAGNLYLPYTITDSFNNSIATNLSLSVLPPFFSNGSLPQLEVRRGQHFSESLAAYMPSSAARYDATVPPEAAWVSFDPVTKVLSGNAPAEIGDTAIIFNARDLAANVTATVPLAIAIVAAPTSPTSPYGPGDGAENRGNTSGLSRSARIALGATFGVLAFLIALVLLVLCYRKRSKQQDQPNRDQSSVFDPAAVQRGKSTPSTLVTLVGKGEGEKRTPSQVATTPSQRSVHVFENERSSKPKRLNFLGLLRNGKRDSSHVISLPQSQSNSLFGLGINDRAAASPHNVVFVTDDLEATNRALSTDAREASRNVVHSNESDRRSSWESGASSSLFYSEHTGENERSAPSHRVATARPAMPRQRRDFLPVPASTSTNSNFHASSDPSTSSSGDIRLVHSPSGFTDSSGSGSHPSRFPSSQQASSLGSDRSIAGPRMVPFTREHTSSEIDLSLRVWRRSHVAGIRASAIQDAFEHDDGRPNVLYAPSQMCGSPTTSAAIFDSSDRHEMDEDDSRDVRFVGSVLGSPEPFESGRQRSTTTSSHQEPLRVHVKVNQPFSFVPSIHPPPFAAISSPGRGPRPTYHAFVEGPSEELADEGLPDWLHFDSNSMQVWGLPRRVDTGTLAFCILERKTLQRPDSPSRNAASSSSRLDVVEEIVGRYVLEVSQNFDDGDARRRPESNGELHVITY